MLSEEARTRLIEMGIFPADDDKKRHDKGNPFFEIRQDSIDPTNQEFERLSERTEAYRARYGPAGTVDTYWGRIANTIVLRKVQEDGWRFRRVGWTDHSEWFPAMHGLSIDALFMKLLHDTA